MEIRLAGMNIDYDLLQESNLAGNPELTPETISAAYARISRSEKRIPALRREARDDVSRTRHSNQTIIFEMGHHSIAEHAVFNLDILDISRLALEALEQFRLVSYTEKSQRYVTLNGDYHLPKTIENPTDRQRISELFESQFKFYQLALSRLKEYHFQNSALTLNQSGGKRTLEGWAKEDARYILPMAMTGQVGVTINARNIEHLMRRFAIHPLDEVQEIGRRIYQLIQPIAPSLILFHNPSEFDSHTFQFSDSPTNCKKNSGNPPYELEVIEFTAAGDDKILAASLANKRGISFQEALIIVATYPMDQKKAIYRQFFDKMEFFDHLPRIFELAGLTFQGVISAANYAQLKRHRMATLLCDDYHPDLGITIPPLFHETGLSEDYFKLQNQVSDLYQGIKKRYGRAADYMLTNGHRRAFIMKMNLRELYHFVRLRSDSHAQWDIRHLSNELAQAAQSIWPFATMLLCGKSEFNQTYRLLFQKDPQYKI